MIFRKCCVSATIGILKDDDDIYLSLVKTIQMWQQFESVVLTLF